MTFIQVAQCLGHSNWTFCSLISQFLSEFFPTFDFHTSGSVPVAFKLALLQPGPFSAFLYWCPLPLCSLLSCNLFTCLPIYFLPWSALAKMPTPLYQLITLFTHLLFILKPLVTMPTIYLPVYLFTLILIYSNLPLPKCWHPCYNIFTCLPIYFLYWSTLIMTLPQCSHPCINWLPTGCPTVSVTTLRGYNSGICWSILKSF